MKDFSETYIYANLDRRATFTLTNCRLLEAKNECKMSNARIDRERKVEKLIPLLETAAWLEIRAIRS